jgi:hypothetical protein
MSDGLAEIRAGICLPRGKPDSPTVLALYTYALLDLGFKKPVILKKGPT